jgi:CO/xanthine dehydrogenase Mo-binding subunit
MIRSTKSEMGQHVGTALAQAIARAIGARVRDLPINPERVNQALKRE